MAKRCVYCSKEISQESVVDVCDRCGLGVWGDRMFNAIKQNMQGMKDKGNLYQGSVTDN
ncbi:hypothetical protein GW924_03125 [Candidatus Pacearchaeota archaeon]|nr:hypothetical protein [Candidatus Pacearchaeota archaeon]